MKKFFIGMAMLVALVAPALAAVVFDRATGTGSVDKQDLIQLFGAEVAATIEAAESVSFSLQRTQVWETECRRRGTQQTRTWRLVTTRTREVLSDVVVTPSDKPKSWTLDGYGSSTVVGRFCPTGWVRIGTPEVFREGTLRLTATFDGESKTLLIVEAATP